MNRAAAAKYLPADHDYVRDPLGDVQHLIIRDQRGDLAKPVTAAQREMARKFFDYEFVTVDPDAPHQFIGRAEDSDWCQHCDHARENELVH